MTLHSLPISCSEPSLADPPLSLSRPAVRVRRIAAATYARLWSEVFRDLADHTRWPNPFLAPEVIGALMGQHRDDSLYVLAAERATRSLPSVLTGMQHGAGIPPAAMDLLGIWVLRVRRDLWSGGIAVLETPLDPLFHPTSEAVIRNGYEEPVWSALIAWLTDDRDIPRVIRASAWPRDLTSLLPESVQVREAEIWDRAITDPAGPVTAEGYLRAALGRHWRKRKAERRKLEQEGCLRHVTCRGTEVPDALSHFVRLEAAGWKGRKGTALLQQPAKRAEVEATILALAGADRLAIDQLWLDSRLIATGIVCEAGRHALYWKTAYDEAAERHAPGRLLAIAMLERLFAHDPMSTLDSGMMEFTNADIQIWGERRSHSRAHLLLPMAQRRGWAQSWKLDLAVPVIGWRLRHACRRAQRWIRQRWG